MWLKIVKDVLTSWYSLNFRLTCFTTTEMMYVPVPFVDKLFYLFPTCRPIKANFSFVLTLRHMISVFINIEN